MITLHFYLKFRSSYGQQFFVVGNHAALGNDAHSAAVAMQYLNEDYWHVAIDVDEKSAASIQYKYLLRHSDGFESTEWLADKTVNLTKAKTAEIQLLDTWNYSGYFQNAFYTQPFRQTLGRREKPAFQSHDQKKPTHNFKVKAPMLTENQTVMMVGSVPELGNWQTANGLWMRENAEWFELEVNLSDATFPIAYKYGIVDTQSGEFLRWEDGDNRVLFGIGKRQFSILHDGFIQLPHPNFRGAGVAIPVFSLRTSKSFGVGEFTDIRQLADWSAQVGLNLIQLLPVNDTTSTHNWTDSYPYAPISVFGLHPIYLNIGMVAGEENAALISPILKKQEALNALPEVDYEAVMSAKWQAIKKLYPALKKDWLAEKDYQQFFVQNSEWLLPYAAFCYLRNRYKSADCSVWKTHSSYNAAAIARLFNEKNKSFDQVGIHLFVQYHLHKQLKNAVDYTHSKGIILKGDLPIGIYRYSCDAWVEPELYNMEYQAGAPPDDFAIKGQNWGFPTYNWQRMQADGFVWWKRRFAQMSEYFDAFRIDHILGFFRIWSIPNHAIEGIMGHFVPCLPVHKNEFAERAIWFDYDRYTKPFINYEIVQEFFGEEAQYAFENFLDDKGWGNYALKEEVNTQRKVEAWFAAHAEVPEWLKFKLFDLNSNIILFADASDPENQFHFRIAVEDTKSWQYLDEQVRSQLRDLYVNYFFRRQDEFWRQQAMQKLPALKSATKMLICGEDLGMVPECVPGVMRDLGLLSLEIQRMPKDPSKKFFHPADAPYLSVVTPSTHDMSTIRGWWEENTDNSQLFYNSELGQYGGSPFYCQGWINRAIVTQHLYSPAMWSIFQLQDLLGSDESIRRENPNEERINVPANPKHYWRYRMHLSLEELMKQTAFNGDLTALLKGSGRL